MSGSSAQGSSGKLTLGQYLASIRTDRKLTLRQVEEATNKEVSNAYLSQIENDKIQQPSPNVLHALADIYVIDMVGVLVLREVGVIIVAVMVAGRSGSAYTAELGSMRMREEVDALRTMGFDPTEVLILPRIVALLIAVPILTFLGSMSAIYGGALVAWGYGGINPDVFLSRLKEAISLDTFEVGMIKAPFMALVIGIVACVEGFKVEGSAESLGLHTTASVVKAIFLVIVFDGLFAMFFASIGK